MSERVYKQLQAVVSNADTPAQTAALRLALQSLLLDAQFVLADAEEVYVRSRLDEAAWSDDIRHSLEVIAARWKRQRIQQLGGKEGQTPSRPTDEGHNPMNTSIPDVSLPENGRRMTDDDKNLLDAIIQELRSEGPQWTMPPTKLDRARQALLDGRIEPGYPPGLWHAHGTKKADGTIPSYTITDRCTCPQGSEYGKSKYCTHMTAVEIARRMAEAKAHHGQWQLFGPPQTVEERLAARPGNPEDDWPAETGEEPAEAPGEPQEPRTLPDKTIRAESAHETLGEAPAGLEEALVETTGVKASDDPGHPARRDPLRIPKKHTTDVHGQPHITYKGLIAAAQKEGLLSLAVEWTYNDAELSLAHAVARFHDGRVYEESGDATKENVRPMVQQHFRRMALTRAGARCLRNALGIGEVAIEELGGESPSPAGSEVPDMTAALTPQEAREEIRRLLSAQGYTVTGQRQAQQVLERCGINYAFTEVNYGKIIAKLKELAPVS
jgi:hypothetical protein